MTLLKRLLAVGTAAAITLLGLVPAPAQAVPVTKPVTAAANWLAAHPATADDGYGYQVYNATGLAVAHTKATADELRTRVADLRTGAAAAVPGKPGTAASLIVLAKALHLSTKNFGGVNLVTELRAGISADGQVGAYGSAYGQAMAIIALKRAGTAVPAAVVTKLLTFQDASGAFGYDYGGFVADPDSTALAIQALNLVGKHKTVVAKAIAWAKSTQTAAGYWDSWSPIDSTALMASAFKTSSKKVFKPLASRYTKAYKWLKTKQLSDGGFPSTLDGTSSDQMATYDALYLLTGTSMSTFSYKLSPFTKKAQPKIVGTAKVGNTLTVKTGTTKPSAITSIQWLRRGRPIAGATAATYTVTAKDVGRYLRVKVTYTQVGYKTVVKISAGKKAHQ
ncbi:MAG: terpene cyclase/mutase family protein [Propionibacteriales bacterium]|nr:terpene cyclase/mutase family protein [Propionibacteriales bacterium]